jgi:16S rRNA (cytidine1402-2'-O)-methyltransferase
MPCGTLYVVPTPIGNLEDITLRAVRILKECDFVACEDTRQTAKLLNHLGISKKLVSFYSYNQAGRIPQLIGDLQAGKNIALVSDGGTPGISDPGFFLTSKAIEEAIPVVALPGPSASVTALVGSGLPSDGFVFLGFLKKKPGKMKKELLAALELGKTVVFYESPHRIKKTVELVGELVPPGAKIVIGRELTKKFEEYIRGTAAEVCEAVRTRELIGEMTVLINIGKEQEREENEEN